MRFFVGVVVVVVAYGFGGSLGRSAVLSHSRGRDVGMDQKQRVHVLLVVQQLLHILKELSIIGTGLGSLRLSLFADHDDVPPLQMDRFGRILVFQGVYEIILQIVFAQAVIFGVVSKQRRESLGFEHEARVNWCQP